MHSIQFALDDPSLTGTTITVAGWVRTFRNDRFIALNDGSTIRNLQCVIDQQEVGAATRARFTTGASVQCTGQLVASEGSGQRVEMKVTAVEVIGDCPPDKYPIQPKKHSLEFLRENAHLRFRTNTYSAVFRMRHQVSFGIHEYFDMHGYNYFHAPIITASDAEGAGEMFRVTTLNPSKPPLKGPFKKVNLEADYFDIRAEYWDTILSYLLERKEKFGDPGQYFRQAQMPKDNSLARMDTEPDEGLRTMIAWLFASSESMLEDGSSAQLQAHPLSPQEQEDLNRIKGFHDRLLLALRTGEMKHDLKYFSTEIERISKAKGHVFLNASENGSMRIVPTALLPEYTIAFSNLFIILPSEVDFKEDFFGAESHLTVSGQLQAETAALALGKVYTFGPTFRAENSNTTRHLAEFWMIEPEAAFMDLTGDMDLAEGLCKHLIARVLRNSMDDLQFLDARLAEEEKAKPQDQRSEMGLIDRLKFVLEDPFERITYDEAINILLKSKPYQKKKFQFPVEWGVDLQSEHERYLVEKHFKKPVIVTGYPAKIKAFYMRTNAPGDFGYSEKGKTVAAMDVLFPGIGEIIGGSQREERLDVLEARMKEMNVSTDELSWYLDTRRFGTVPHAGFGLGLERFVLFVTGMGNIRDVIPYPRAPKSAEF